MPYRICKRFEVESAHMLSKHPDRCRFPHGHSRIVEVVLCADTLDAADMVCDFKAVKIAISDFLDSFDHAFCINTQDPLLPGLKEMPETRLIEFENCDPTTEVMARHMFDYIQAAICGGKCELSAEGKHYSIGRNVKLERVRLWETSTTWAEYSGQ